MKPVTLEWMDKLRAMEENDYTTPAILEKLKAYGESEEKRINKKFNEV